MLNRFRKMLGMKPKPVKIHPSILIEAYRNLRDENKQLREELAHLRALLGEVKTL